MNVSLLHSRRGLLSTVGRHVQQVRHMGKQSDRLAKPKLIKRMVYDLVTEPLVYRPKPKLSVTCPKGKRFQSIETGMKQLNFTDKITLEYKGNISPYEQFLMKQMFKLLNESKIVAVCQRTPINGRNWNKVSYKLKQKDFYIAHWAKTKLVRMMIEKTRYKNLGPLCITNNVFIASKESDNIPDLLAILKKTPEFTLLGMLYNGRILNIKEVERLANTSIELQRGEFVSILNMAAGQKTHSLLSQHQQMLAMNLDQYIKQYRENPPPNSPTSVKDAETSSTTESGASAATVESTAAGSEQKSSSATAEDGMESNPTTASDAESTSRETKASEADAQSSNSDSDSSDSDSDSDSDTNK